MNNFPIWADHILAFIFCLLLPVLAIMQGRTVRQATRFSSRQKRVFYFSNCISLSVMAGIVLAVWLLCKRPMPALGLTLHIEENVWIWPLLAFIALYAMDTIYSVSTPQRTADSAAEWEMRTPFLPVNGKEFRPYLLLCLCAGIFEEVVYRGWMVTYFSYLFRDSAWRQGLSVLVPALIFSISHYYHGWKNIIKIFILSAFFGYIYILSGSLVIVMILHFLTNVAGGLLSMKYMKEPVKEEDSV
jgi:hypothetical protein